MLACGEALLSGVEDEVMLSSTLVVTCTEVLVMDTAGVPLLLLLKQSLALVFFSEDEDGSGEEDPDLLSFEEKSGSTRQALGVSRSMLCLAIKWCLMATISEAMYEQSLQTLSFFAVTPKCSA